MPGFSKGPGYNTPFGKKEYLRSTEESKFESYTCAASTVADETVDGNIVKVLQPGTVMAKITSGPESGRIGPFTLEVGVTDGRQTPANIVGLNHTFLPWQLKERDVEVAVNYDCTAVQAWSTEYDAAGAPAVLADLTADTMQNGKSMDIKFV